jgi:hypothetical protein
VGLVVSAGHGIVLLGDRVVFLGGRVVLLGGTVALLEDGVVLLEDGVVLLEPRMRRAFLVNRARFSERRGLFVVFVAVAIVVAVLAADGGLEVTQAIAQLSRHLGQSLGAEHEQSDHQDEQQVRRLKDVAHHRSHLMYPCGGVAYEDWPSAVLSAVQLSGELPGERVPLAPVAAG